MFEETLDPHVHIVARDAVSVEYFADNGERWHITGQCNLCGACYKGTIDPLVAVDESRIGQPNAAQRLDGEPWYRRPVRPEIIDTLECVLKGDYL